MGELLFVFLPLILYVVLAYGSTFLIACALALRSNASAKRKLVYIVLSVAGSLLVTEVLGALVLYALSQTGLYDWPSLPLLRMVTVPLSAAITSIGLYKYWLQRPPSAR